MSADVNRLAGETSPYLLQHKDNPVHWWPWSEAAFAAARAQNKPVLLSVGYSACHWCHVMAHESFEDDETAGLMNAHFINIKVDREERPDVDTIYQKALALMGEHGGWPLTMFLEPDGRPFMGGTYFPPSPAYGRPGFAQVLGHVDQLWREQREQVSAQSLAMTQAIGEHHRERLKDGLSLELLDTAAERLLDYIDASSGGMNGAPKFPMPFVFDFLWRAWKRTGDPRFKAAVVVTLTRMAQGGIYDHIGGGFARYSTDAEWLVPHFEKMLYDNAQLVELMTLVWQETKNPLLETRVRETIAWVLHEMMGENNAFAASYDADSDGEEGKFYVWTDSEIDAVLGADAVLFKKVYDVTPEGNWEGRSILNRSADALTPFDTELDARLAPLREKLYAVRAKRTPPGRDDKVLVDWNGLMILALARAGLAFNEHVWIAAAEKAFTAVVHTMTWTDDDGRVRLGHSFCRGRLQQTAMLDDYANMTRAALALHAATGAAAYLVQAEAWVGLAESLYGDADAGGYFFTSNEAADLIVRTKSATDSAVPSGNGSMALALAELFYLTGKPSHRTLAERTITELEVNAMKSFPHGVVLLNAFELLEKAVQVIIVGDRKMAETETLLRAVMDHSVPNLVLNIIAEGDTLPATHPAYDKARLNGAAAVYVCRGPVCSAPQTTPEGLSQTLNS